MCAAATWKEFPDLDWSNFGIFGKLPRKWEDEVESREWGEIWKYPTFSSTHSCCSVSLVMHFSHRIFVDKYFCFLVSLDTKVWYLDVFAHRFVQFGTEVWAVSLLWAVSGFCIFRYLYICGFVDFMQAHFQRLFQLYLCCKQTCVDRPQSLSKNLTASRIG